MAIMKMNWILESATAEQNPAWIKHKKDERRYIFYNLSVNEMPTIHNQIHFHGLISLVRGGYFRNCSTKQPRSHYVK